MHEIKSVMSFLSLSIIIMVYFNKGDKETVGFVAGGRDLSFWLQARDLEISKVYLPVESCDLIIILDHV